LDIGKDSPKENIGEDIWRVAKMQIFQLIYTKVAPEESPWKKADFHTETPCICAFLYPKVWNSKRGIGG